MVHLDAFFERDSKCGIRDWDRQKDVEHFSDILRTSINEANNYEGQSGNLRDTEKTLAVKNFDARELAGPEVHWHHDDARRADHRAKSDEELRIADIAAQSVCKVQDISAVGVWAKVRVGTRMRREDQFGKGNKDAHRRGKNSWSMGGGKKGGTDHEKGGNSDSRLCWNWRDGTHCSVCPKNWSNRLNAQAEGDESISEELHDNARMVHTGRK